MPERSWNMLKLVPGISASRKNSLITGLARIDENTDELILSAYHLPEPEEFLHVKQGSYYAWYFDAARDRWGLVGELQQKNGLTYSLKRKEAPGGDSIFISVESQGEKPRQPGELVLASNPELFYKELVEGITEPVVEIQSTPQNESIEEFSEVLPDVQELPEKQNEVKLGDVEKDLMVENEEKELECSAAQSTTVKKSEGEELTSLKEPTVHNKEDEGTMSLEFWGQFFDDQVMQEVMGTVRERYALLKNEVDLQEYWQKSRQYLADLYTELELDQLIKEISEDMNGLLAKVDRGQFFNKLEGLILELTQIFDLQSWLAQAKAWVKELNYRDIAHKTRVYGEEILQEVKPEQLWQKVRSWLETTLDQMDVDEILAGMQETIHRLGQMEPVEMKDEAQRFVKNMIDELEMPEIKFAIIKASFKERMEQMGGFFKGVYQKINQKEKAVHQRKVDRGVSQYSPPLNRTPFQPHRPKRGYAAGGQVNFHGQPQNPWQSATMQREKSSQRQSQQKAYGNPYIFKAYPESAPEINGPAGDYGYYYQPNQGLPNYNPQYSHPGFYPSHPCANCICGKCAQNHQIGWDALGAVRYFYPQEADNYYFITPDGEMVRRS